MTSATMSGDNSTLANKCLDICQALTSKGSVFTFSLNIGSKFSFSLDTRVSSTSTEMVKKKLSPSAKRIYVRRKEEFIKRKLEALKKSENNLEVETSSQVETFQWDQCDHSFKTENGLKIHIGKTHKDLIPQLDGQPEDITTDLVVKTDKEAEVQIEPGYVTVAVKTVLKTYEIFVKESLREGIEENLTVFGRGIT